MIQKDPAYESLVQQTYVSTDLRDNVDRFINSEEWSATLKLIDQYHQLPGKSVMDIGCGNGISSLAFAKMGFDVTAVEPDPSKIVGAGAIKQLKDELDVENLIIHESFAEEIGFPDEVFDIVYARQAMHHANELSTFVAEMSRVLKPNGLFITVRDHVIFDEQDKQNFLDKHPLHSFYGGENAYTSMEYQAAIKKAGLKLIREIKYQDSIINRFPAAKVSLEEFNQKRKRMLQSQLKSKLGAIAAFPPIQSWYLRRAGYPYNEMDIERSIPGRMYSYIACKE